MGSTIRPTASRPHAAPSAQQKNLDQILAAKPAGAKKLTKLPPKTNLAKAKSPSTTPQPLLAQATTSSPPPAANTRPRGTVGTQTGAPQNTKAKQDSTPTSAFKLQTGAAGVRGAAYGSYKPSFRDFSSKPLKPLQKLMADSPGNRLVDGVGRDQYNATTRAKASEVLGKIDSGKLSAQAGAYEAATYRDGQTVHIRKTSTSPESLAEIAKARGDKPTDAVVERLKDPAAMKQYVDTKLYPKTQAKLTDQGKPSAPENVYREIVESSGRPNPAWNAKALQRSALAEKIKVGGRSLGRVATAVGVATDGLSLYGEIRTSAKTGNYNNTYKEGARIAGGWTGAWVGGKVGASTGAVIGGALGSVVPILGNGVGAAVGGIVGGLIGGVAGYWAGEQVGKTVYNTATSQPSPATP
jgi:hypothetical protein